MNETESRGLPVFRMRFAVPAEAIDQNGHVNNVRYLEWMQDIAVHHWRAVGGETVNAENNATWVARSHHIEYLRPAYEGNHIEAVTWVTTLRRVRSQRCYRFKRLDDDQILATGETDWVFVDQRSGRPRTVPAIVSSMLPLSKGPD